MEGKYLFTAEYTSEGDLMDNVLTLYITDPTVTIPEGSHTLTIVFYDGTILTYDFTV